MTKKAVKKIVLAYSGGLDTSVMLHWLRERYDAEVVCYSAEDRNAHTLGRFFTIHLPRQLSHTFKINFVHFISIA